MLVKKRAIALLAIGISFAAPTAAADMPAVCPIYRDEATRAILAGPKSQWPKVLEWATADIQRATLQLRIGMAESDIEMLEAARPTFESRSNLFNGDPPFGTLLAALAYINTDPVLLNRAEAIYEKAVRVDWGGESSASGLVSILATRARGLEVPEAIPLWDKSEQLIRKQAKRAGGEQELDSDWHRLKNDIGFSRAIRQNNALGVEAAVSAQRTQMAAETDPIKRVELSRELAYFLIHRAERFDQMDHTQDLREASTLLAGILAPSSTSASTLAFAERLKPASENLAGAWNADKNECARAARDRAVLAWAALLSAGSDEQKRRVARTDLATADKMLAAQPLHLQPAEFPAKLTESLLDSAERNTDAARAGLLADARQALDEADNRAAHCFCADTRAELAKQRKRLAAASGP